LVTSGPGVTNAVTGIATAYMDSIPLVIITGQVPTHAIGQDAFQEVDTVGITRPCVKHNFLVKDVRDIASTVKKAFYLAAVAGRAHRGGYPKGRHRGEVQVRVSRHVEMRSYSPVTKGHAGRSRRRSPC
jgi:acetolactate synthase I/II/III large subunit